MAVQSVNFVLVGEVAQVDEPVARRRSGPVALGRVAFELWPSGGVLTPKVLERLAGLGFARRVRGYGAVVNSVVVGP